MRPENKTILFPVGDLQSHNALKAYVMPIADVFGSTITVMVIGDEQSFKTLRVNILNFLGNAVFQARIRFTNFFSLFNPSAIMAQNASNEEVMMVIFPKLPTGRLAFIREMTFMLRTQKLRLPYMVLPSSTEVDWQPTNIIIPVGYDRNDKASAVWASYFARFNNSNVIILYARENEKWAINQTRNNVRFFKKLFHDLGLTHTLKPANSGSGKLPDEAVEEAALLKNSLVIITTTRYYSIEHYFLGPKELNVIKNRQDIPILCINPRKDSYILCR
jgi:hypothetical protein